MIGTTLSFSQMSSIVMRLAALKHPWVLKAAILDLRSRPSHSPDIRNRLNRPSLRVTRFNSTVHV